MKVVRLQNLVVSEVIPNYALPVEKWYNEEFAKDCMEAPEYVEQGWVYHPDTETWSEPSESVLPEPEPTQLDIIEAQIAYTAMMTDTLLEV